MAIGFLRISKISRSTGATACARMAYVMRSRIQDPRIATTHDYRKKRADDLLAYGIVGWTGSAESLAPAMSAAERRGDACEGRSAILAVPHELNIGQSAALIADWCQSLNKRHGVACAWALHAPDSAGDERNIHAHVVITGRRSNGNALTEKARELDDRKTGPAAIEAWRSTWGDLAERALQQAGKGQPVHMRSWRRRLNAKGLPGDLIQGEEHLGPARSSAERRGQKTRAGSRNQKRRRGRSVAEKLIAERAGIARREGSERNGAGKHAASLHVKQTKNLSESINAPKRKSGFEKAVRKTDRLIDDLAEDIVENASSRDDDQR